MLLTIIGLALRLISFGMLLYCILSFVMPDSTIYATLARYVDPVLNPIRQKMWQWFPATRAWRVDISPLVLWLIIDILLRIVHAL